jgi:hypothetical protein
MVLAENQQSVVIETPKPLNEKASSETSKTIDDKEALEYYTDLRNHENDIFWKKINAVLVLAAALIAFYSISISNKSDKLILVFALGIGFLISTYLFVTSKHDSKLLSHLEDKVSEYSKKVYGIAVFNVYDPKSKQTFNISRESRKYIIWIFSMLAAVQITIAFYLYIDINILKNYDIIYSITIVFFMIGALYTFFRESRNLSK